MVEIAGFDTEARDALAEELENWIVLDDPEDDLSGDAPVYVDDGPEDDEAPAPDEGEDDGGEDIPDGEDSPPVAADDPEATPVSAMAEDDENWLEKLFGWFFDLLSRLFGTDDGDAATVAETPGDVSAEEPEGGDAGTDGETDGQDDGEDDGVDDLFLDDEIAGDEAPEDGLEDDCPEEMWL